MDNGDYVRTKEFGISRVKWFDNNEPILENGFTALQKEYKSSPNIIDLIEVGDFIGKTIVEEVKEFDDGTRVIVMADGFDEYDENEYFLKAGIVTKEQFENMEYKVGE